MYHKMSDSSTFYNFQYMLLRDDHKILLSILMNVLMIDNNRDFEYHIQTNVGDTEQNISD